MEINMEQKIKCVVWDLDNTLWDGHVVDPAYDHDQQTIGIRNFNDHISRDPRVEKVILPLRDGLTLIKIL